MEEREKIPAWPGLPALFQWQWGAALGIGGPRAGGLKDRVILPLPGKGGRGHQVPRAAPWAEEFRALGAARQKVAA